MATAPHLRKSGIYKITNPMGSIYIGQSVDIAERIGSYRNLRCKSQSKLYCSLKKYGWQKHTFEIIHPCVIYELNELEVYYIKLYDTFNTKHGLNLRSGGESCGTLAEEVKIKIRAKRSNQIITPAQYKKAADKRKSWYSHSEETKTKISQSQLGKTISPDSVKKANATRKKIYQNLSEEGKLELNERMRYVRFFQKRINIGEKISKGRKDKFVLGKHKSGKPIVQKTIKGTIINNFGSSCHANSITGINTSHIAACCRGERKTAGGFIWGFKTDAA